MRMRLANNQVAKLKSALAQAGTKEIGGQLFGEQLAPSDFRVTEIAIQARRGSFARFLVDLVEAGRNALRFFDRTEHRYKRFNYIGEWHSHPSFELKPSPQDVETMVKLVTDPAFKGSFAILMIVRLDGDHVSMGACLFDPQGTARAINLESASGS
ncbi:MAG: Mov34/MPN/PAD-1 family protein [Proteobacteria bacterium]|nr:Mov34/MPN/PAD-1 family protein [Pseudomonadota bacterium]